MNAASLQHLVEMFFDTFCDLTISFVNSLSSFHSSPYPSSLLLVPPGEPCATYRTCSTCMSDPFCGWCPSTQLCSEGNKNGPLFGKCGDWEHGAMQSGCNSDGPPQAEADGPPTGA